MLNARFVVLFWSWLVLGAACGEDSSGGGQAGDGDVSAEFGDTEVGDADAGAPDTSDTTPEPPVGLQRPATPVDPLVDVGSATLLLDGYTFTEGPVWDAVNARLLFTDTREGTITAWRPGADAETLYDDTEGGNGLALDSLGRLLVCEMEGHRVTRRSDAAGLEVLVDSYDGSRLNAPNDVAVRYDDIVYFTDPPFRTVGERELDFLGLYRLEPDGELTLEWSRPDPQTPNGVVLSPDHTVLYVADSAAAEVIAFDVAGDGSLDEERSFADTSVVPDGMTVDDNWNLYVATGSGVEVFSPAGDLWGTIAIDGLPSNCAFGGDDGTTLYVTARAAVYSVEVPGAARQ